MFNFGTILHPEWNTNAKCKACRDKKVLDYLRLDFPLDMPYSEIRKVLVDEDLKIQYIKIYKERCWHCNEEKQHRDLPRSSYRPHP